MRRLQNITKDFGAKGAVEEKLVGVQLTTDLDEQITINPVVLVHDKILNNAKLVADLPPLKVEQYPLPHYFKFVPSAMGDIIINPDWLFTWISAVWTLNPLILVPKYLTFSNLGFLVLKFAMIKYCLIPVLVWLILRFYSCLSKKV